VTYYTARDWSLGGLTPAPQTVGSAPDFLVADGSLGAGTLSATARSSPTTAITNCCSARSAQAPDATPTARKDEIPRLHAGAAPQTQPCENPVGTPHGPHGERGP
jgi:hypothetical protein